ncbi:hypothetical protein EWM64_g2352 [Hericium alpestre]|uniref:Uncharacterized protein n=1 Tax=Hericium alpestre TaxID=135208 RepID=A0A4Z0A600_9AGAM|nr:hypothetical protein EWM64_g2352 [Hericium alpestre]
MSASKRRKVTKSNDGEDDDSQEPVQFPKRNRRPKKGYFPSDYEQSEDERPTKARPSGPVMKIGPPKGKRSEEDDRNGQPVPLKIGPPKGKRKAPSASGSVADARSKSTSLPADKPAQAAPLKPKTSSFGDARPHTKSVLQAMHSTATLTSNKPVLTESQIDALREEEESQSQTQNQAQDSRLLSPQRAEPEQLTAGTEDDDVQLRSSMAFHPEEEEEPGPDEDDTTRENAPSPSMGPNSQAQRQLESEPSFSISRTVVKTNSSRKRLSRTRMTASTPAEDSSSEEQDNDKDDKNPQEPALRASRSSSTARSAPPAAIVNPALAEFVRSKTTQAASSSTAGATTAKAKPLRSIPQISPSAFAPHLKHKEDVAPTSSIEQFDSPEKRLAASSVRDWDERSPAVPSGKPGLNIDMRERLAQMRAGQASASGRKPMRSLQDITRGRGGSSSLKFQTVFPNPAGALNKGKEKEKDKERDERDEFEKAMEILQQETQSQGSSVDENGDGKGKGKETQPEGGEMEIDFDQGRSERAPSGVEDEVAVEESLRVSVATSPRPQQQNSQEHDIIPPTSSSKHISDESQSQSQGGPQPSPAAQLTSALNVLNMKSEEISKLEKELEMQRELAADYRAKWEAESSWRRAQEASRRAFSVVEVQTDLMEMELTHLPLPLPQAAPDTSLNDERARWEAEHLELQQKISALESAKAAAASDRDFFQEQYRAASAFTGEVRAENEELLNRATVAESQAKTGVTLVRTTYETRIVKLEQEVRKQRAMIHMFQERAQRTDDNLRLQAAMAPELYRENALLREDALQRNAVVNELEEDNKELEKDIMSLERKLEKMEKKLSIAERDKGKEKEKKKEDKVERKPDMDCDEDEDEDYVPGQTDESGSGSGSDSESDTSEGSRPGVNVVQGAVSPAVDSPSSPGPEVMAPNDLAYTCGWRPSDTHKRCDFAVGSQEDLKEHFYSAHVVS